MFCSSVPAPVRMFLGSASAHVRRRADHPTLIVLVPLGVTNGSRIREEGGRAAAEVRQKSRRGVVGVRMPLVSVMGRDGLPFGSGDLTRL